AGSCIQHDLLPGRPSGNAPFNDIVACRTIRVCLGYAGERDRGGVATLLLFAGLAQHGRNHSEHAPPAERQACPVNTFCLGHRSLYHLPIVLDSAINVPIASILWAGASAIYGVREHPGEDVATITVKAWL